MRTIAAALIAAIALAGCDRHEVNEVNASVDDVANALAEAGPSVRLQPGRWETSGEVVALDAPGMPPQAQDMMKKQMTANAGRVAVCLRQEDVEKPNAGFFGQTSDDCRFDHYRMDRGSIDARMTCPSPSDGSVTTSMTGSYASDRYDMEMSSQLAGLGAQQPMTMRMKVRSRRVGDCQGNEYQAPSRA